MSIETILPWIMSECGLDVSAPDISSSDYQMRQIAALMNAAGKDINTRAEWSGAMKTQIVNSGNSAVAVPSDFQRVSGASGVSLNAGTGETLRPVTDRAMWSFLAANEPESGYYMVRDGYIYFLPTLATQAVINYVSTNWLDGSKSVVDDNANQPIFSEDLLARGVIWRWRRQKGLDYQDLMAEFEADLEAAIKADRGV